MTDHHVDRPEVEAGQPAQLTGTNRSIGFCVRTQRQRSPRGSAYARTRPAERCPGESRGPSNQVPEIRKGRQPSSGGTPFRPADTHTTRFKRLGSAPEPRVRYLLIPGSLAPDPWSSGRPGGHSEGQNTRSHPELGRENPQRRWYYVSRRGRVGRRQVFKAKIIRSPIPTTNTTTDLVREPR